MSSLACTASSRFGGGFSLEIVEQRSGILVFRATGNGADAAFANEAGGHRWQRIPPTEKRGRVQTSTVTVAVLAEPTEVQIQISDRDLEWSATRGSGPGGQNRNKTETCVIVKHLPTGLQVRCETERSKEQNQRTALALLRARLWEAQRNRVVSERAADRKAQVGSGMRGDKRRTIRCQDGQVNDHVTGRRWELKAYLRGDW
jgi:peptide chain release factor 1